MFESQRCKRGMRKARLGASARDFLPNNVEELERPARFLQLVSDVDVGPYDVVSRN